MWTLLAVDAAMSLVAALVAVGCAWYDFRPLTDQERARTRPEAN
jgi:hypothetical protein